MHGTAPIAKLHVIRDNKYALTDRAEAAEGRRSPTPTTTPSPGETHYYYVRVEQADGNLAWASPMWITYQP